MPRLTSNKRNRKTPQKEKQKLCSNSLCSEARSCKKYSSQENNDDIDGFSSSASEEDYLEESSRKKRGSWDLSSKNKIDEWRYSDIDECGKIAWSNSSHGDKSSSEESQVDEFGDVSFVQNSSKKHLNVSIKEYGSDEEIPVNIKPTVKKDVLEEISQQTIEELSPSPVIVKRPSLLLTDKKEIFIKGAEEESVCEEYESVEVDSAKKKKIAKGGLAERLQKIITREKSELAFWKHDKKMKQDKDSTFVVQVTTMGSAYSTSSLYCKLLEDVFLYIMLPTDIVEKLKIKQGFILRIYPPWKKIFCKDLNSLVILCAYHIEVLTEDSPLINTSAAQELIKFHQMHIQKFTGDGNEFPLTEDIIMSNLETTHLLRYPTEVKHCTILEAVEQNGYAKYMSFCGRIQRVLCRMVNSVTEDKALFAQKIILSQENDIKEERYGLLVQDNEGAFCEITIPCSLILKKPNWKLIVAEGEGKLCSFKHFRLVKRRTHNRCSSLRSMVESLEPSTELSNEETEGVDSIEDIATQSLGRAVVTSSYLFAVDENTSTIDFKEIPREFSVSYVPCIKFASPINTFPNGRYMVYLKLLALTSSREDNSWSTIFENQCCIYGSCLGKDCSCVHKIKKLSSCFVPGNVAQKIEGKTKDILICLKDLYTYDGQLIADAYTRIFLLQENNSFRDMFTMNYDSSILEEIPLPRVPSLNTSVKEGELIIAQGVICGVDEETALFWNVCRECKSDEILENDEKNVWCDACDRQTSAELNMQLDIFLFVASMPSICILCKLLESTISTLLPKPSEANFEGYDMKRILNKKFGPSLCQVVDVVKESKQNTESKIFLKEVNHFAEYRKI